MPLRINLVGTDGAGKSTVLGLLRDKFESVGRNVVCHNPSGVTYPAEVKLESQTNPKKEPWHIYGYTRLGVAAQVEDTAIQIARECDAVVLGDRDYETCHPVYYPILMQDSPAASVTRQDWQKAFRAHRTCDPADAIFWLDVEPDVAVDRIHESDRDRVQDHEEEETIAQLRAGYTEMESESGGHITRVDTTRMEAEEVAEEIWRQISERFEIV